MNTLWQIKRKAVAILAIALLAVTFSACGDSASGNISSDSTNEVSDTAAPESENSMNEGVRSAQPSDSSDVDSDEKDMINVNITVGNQVFAAKFYDSESARAIISQMPFTLEMDDYASQEKVASLNFTLPSTSTETPATINAGDIYLWSGNSLVLFYTTFSNTYSYVPIGYIVDVAELTDALGRGSVTVDFQIAE